MPIGTNSLYREAFDSLHRIQSFDAESLRRTSDLGAHLNFSETIKPAQDLIDLFKRLSPESLQDFPDQILTLVRDHANNAYKIFEQIAQFSPEGENPKGQHQNLHRKVVDTYPHAFMALHPMISYSLHRSADFQRLDAEARATLQTVEDRAKSFTKSMSSHEEEANRALEEIRKAATEQGVTQQAVHFHAESERHEQQSERWRKATVRLAFILASIAVASLFIHKIPLLRPESTYDTIQLAISKVLVFFVVTYMLVLSARNFMSHKHNAVVNKHRQNALLTHQALVEGANEAGARDAVLLQAAGCIFSPQPTGYTSLSSDDSNNARSIVELASRSAISTARSG